MTMNGLVHLMGRTGNTMQYSLLSVCGLIQVTMAALYKLYLDYRKDWFVCTTSLADSQK